MRISTSTLEGTYLDFDKHVCSKNALNIVGKLLRSSDDQESTLPECSTTE